MAISTDFNYADLLSLEKSVLSARTRDNALGTRELIIAYNNVTSATKEECIEWLDANRDSLTDPYISFKTFEGMWNCVEIAYNEQRSTITQRFKIDAEFKNDVAQKNNGGETLKSYYWRIVNPGDYNIPEYFATGGTLDGLFWADTNQDLNGEDIFYDDTDTYAQWYDGSKWVITVIADVDDLGADYWSSATVTGTYTGAGANAGDDTVIGTESEYLWTKTANDNGDGTYDVVITRSEVTNQEGESASRLWGENKTQSTSPSTDIIVTGYDEANANQTYELTSGNYYDTTGVWTGATTSSWTISYDSSPGKWRLEDGATTKANHPYINLNSSEWYEDDGTTFLPNFVMQIGLNPPAQTTSSIVYTSSQEVKFVADGGTEADPVAGEDKSITNQHIDNGLFRVTITSTIVNQQRVPALIDSEVYASSGNADECALIWARNATYEQYRRDVNVLQVQKINLQNSVSVSINRFGLYDYTIRAVEV